MKHQEGKMHLHNRGRIKLVAIIGPTAVGKTAISLKLAPAISGEIISVDSRQVYRYMDIGTDKVSREDRLRTVHHIIDVADPDETFTAARFVEEAAGAIDRIIARKKIPLLVGGTPFYYSALLGEMLTVSIESDPEIRKKLLQEAEIKGKKHMYNKLATVDPDLALKVHTNDLVRIIRGLEIFHTTGKPASWWHKHGKKIKKPYDVLYLGIIRPRELAYKNIELRAEKQFQSGLIEEVKWLLGNRFDERFHSMQGFGYREVIKYIRGVYSLEEALSYYIKATKAFYRRQMTWFRKFKPALWYDLKEENEEKVLEDLKGRIKRHLGVV